MVYEHKQRGFSPEGLANTFHYATFGNGIVAILAGLAASYVADTWGYVAPFMLALAFLASGTLVVLFSWTENFGDATVDISGTFVNALNHLKSDSKIVLLGAIQSLFEASMYTFVFMWTPALQDDSSDPLPFGLIFASYMVSIMIGSTLFAIFVSNWRVEPEVLGKYIFLVAGISLFVPCLFTNKAVITVAFLMFELSCGLYFPCFGTLRSKYIPETTRSAIMNFFRLPLNGLVVLVLTKVALLSNSTVFMICTGWLFVALILHVQLMRRALHSSRNKHDHELLSPDIDTSS